MVEHGQVKTGILVSSSGESCLVAQSSVVRWNVAGALLCCILFMSSLLLCGDRRRVVAVQLTLMSLGVSTSHSRS